MGVGLETRFLYRLDRTMVLRLEPDINYMFIEDSSVQQRLGYEILLALDLKRVFESDDISFSVDIINPVEQQAYTVAAINYALKRRGYPSVSAALLLGVLNNEAQFGTSLKVNYNFRESSIPLSYSLQLAYEPYRQDGLPLRASLLFTSKQNPHHYSLGAVFVPDNDQGLFQFSLELSYGYAF